MGWYKWKGNSIMNNFEKRFTDLGGQLNETETNETNIGVSLVPFNQGDRVIVDSTRFKSGRDPGRRKEVYTGTVKRMRETDCMIEFDAPVTIRGKKVINMNMKHSYVKPLKETDD